MVSAPPQVIVVHPQRVQAKTLQEFIAFARANPDKLNYGSAGNGTTHHLTGELFKLQTNTKITHVPYRGAGPALADLVAGQIDVMFDGLGSSASHIQAGTLRALAVAAPKRSPPFPTCRPRPKPACPASRSRPGTLCGRPRRRPPNSSPACAENWQPRSPPSRSATPGPATAPTSRP